MKNVLKLFIGLAMFFVLVFLFANFAKANSVPRYLGYSGTLNSAAGTSVTGSYNIVFKIYNTASGGTTLWTETHSAVDVSGGFFSVTLGDTTALDIDFSERYWLGITVATDSEMTPRTPISSVGYSFVSDMSYGAFTSSTASATSTASGGDIYYNTGDGNLYVYDSIGDEWVDVTSQGVDIVDGTTTSTILTWDGSNWSENTNFLVDASGVVTTGTWHGARIDISDYTNLAVDGDLVLTGDTLSVSSTIARASDLHSAITFDTSTYNYLSLNGQQIVLGQIDIAGDTNLVGDSEVVLTGNALSLSSTIARDSELHNAVTLNTSTYNYLTLTGQEIALGQIDIADTNIAQGAGIVITNGSIAATLGTNVDLATSEVTGVLALTNGGTGATTATGARSALGLGTLATLSAVNSSYITDLSIVNADISASAGIVDTKLATISTAGKVSDSALSSNVTKLGSSIDISSETNLSAGNGVVLSDYYLYASLGTTVDLTSEITGTLGVSNGGTGSTSYAQGSIVFSNGSALVQDNANFFWDNTSKALGIGDNTPDHTLDVAGNIGLASSGYINFGDTDGTDGYGLRDNVGTIQYKNSGGAWSDFSAGGGSGITGTEGYTIIFDSNGSQTATSSLFITSSGTVGINTTSTASSTLNVAGTIGSYGLTLSGEPPVDSGVNSGPAPGDYVDYITDANTTTFSYEMSSNNMAVFENGNIFYTYNNTVDANWEYSVKDINGNDIVINQIIEPGQTIIKVKRVSNFVVVVMTANNENYYYKIYDNNGNGLTNLSPLGNGIYNIDIVPDYSENNFYFIYTNSYTDIIYNKCYFLIGNPNSYCIGSFSFAFYPNTSYLTATTLSNNDILVVYNNSGSSNNYYAVYNPFYDSWRSVGSSLITDVVITKASLTALADGGASLVYIDSAGDYYYRYLDYVDPVNNLFTAGTAQLLHDTTNIASNLDSFQMPDNSVAVFYDDAESSFTKNVNFYYQILNSGVTSTLQTETFLKSTTFDGDYSMQAAGSLVENKFYFAYSDKTNNSSNYWSMSGGITPYYEAVTSVAFDSLSSLPNINHADTAVFPNGNIMQSYFVLNSSSIYFVIYDSSGDVVTATTTVTTDVHYDSKPVLTTLSDGNVALIYVNSANTLYYRVYSDTGVVVLSDTVIVTNGSGVGPLKAVAMSDGDFFVAYFDSYYSNLNYSVCNSSGSCSITYLSTGYSIFDISLSVLGSGSSEKVFITNTDTNSMGNYWVYTEGVGITEGPLVVNGGAPFVFSKISTETLSNDNVVIFFISNYTFECKYQIWNGSTLGTINSCFSNSLSGNIESLDSTTLENGDILLVYNAVSYGIKYTLYEIFSGDMSSVVNPARIVDVGSAQDIRVDSIPNTNKFVYSSLQKNNFGQGIETFRIFSSNGSASSGNNIDLFFADIDGAIQWTQRLSTSQNRLYFLDAGGDNGVYLAQDTTSWTSNSDRRLKTDILELSVLDRIDNYRAVSFNWIKNGNPDVGAIAQELYKIFPEVVTVGSDTLGPNGEGAWGIQYAKLGALALEGVKELKQQLDVYNALLLGGGLNDFLNDKAVNKSLVFSRNVAFIKHIALSQDSVGMALIQAGESGVRIEFKEEYSTIPVVTLTLASNSPVNKYYVSDVDIKGFTVYIEPTATQDTLINWHAFAQLSDEENIIVSSTNNNINTDNGSSISSDSLSNIANNYLQINNLTDEDITNAENISNNEETGVENTDTTSTEDNIVEIVTSTEEIVVVETSTTTEAVVDLLEEVVIDEATTSTEVDTTTTSTPN